MTAAATARETPMPKSKPRGIRLAKEMTEDPYIKALLNLCHSDPLNRFLDRLLLASIIEFSGSINKEDKINKRLNTL